MMWIIVQYYHSSTLHVQCMQLINHLIQMVEPTAIYVFHSMLLN